MHLLTNRAQMSKYGWNISATFLLPHFDVDFDLLLHKCMATWDLFTCSQQ